MAQDKDVRFQLSLFERWQLRHGETEVHLAGRQQRLVSALAIYGARHRRYLSGLLWPDSREACAMESLRVTVHLISRQAPGLLAVEGSVLSLVDGVRVDFQDLLARIKDCERSDSNSTHDACLAHIQPAHLLPGWYEDWVILEQHKLRDVYLRTLIVHARRWLDVGEAEKAMEAAKTALELEPLHEICAGLLMRAELNTGNRAEALRVFANFRTRLLDELGLSPSEHLVKLALAIRG